MSVAEYMIGIYKELLAGNVFADALSESEAEGSGYLLSCYVRYDTRLAFLCVATLGDGVKPLAWLRIFYTLVLW